MVTFGEQVQAILSRNGSVTATDIISAASPMSPPGWLGLVLLLDQSPRNCYRGADAKTVFNVFDPLALAVTLQAIDEGIQDCRTSATMSATACGSTCRSSTQSPARSRCCLPRNTRRSSPVSNP